MVIIKMPERIKPRFSRYIGIDYSGAENPEASLKGLRVYEASRVSVPVEVEAPPSPRKYWTRLGGQIDPAGSPWLRYLRYRLGERIHFWPFDGSEIPAGKSALVEAYPSLWSKSTPREGRRPDQQDAYFAAAWLRQVDMDGSIGNFSSPTCCPANIPLLRSRGGFWE